jgi:hypothetical protein
VNDLSYLTRIQNLTNAHEMTRFYRTINVASNSNIIEFEIEPS